MDYQIEKRKKPLKTILLVLTIVSIVAFFVSKMAYFDFLSDTMGGFSGDILITVVFWGFIQVSPLLMLLICVIMLHKTEKEKTLLSFVFVALVMQILFGYLLNIALDDYYFIITNIYFYLEVFGIVPSFVVAMIYGVKGKLNKVFIIIGCSIALLMCSISLFANCFNMFKNFRDVIHYFDIFYLYITNVCFALSFLLLYLVIFLLVVTNKNAAKEPQSMPEDTYCAPYQEEYQRYQEYQNYQAYQSYEYSEPQVAYEPTPEPPRAQELTSEQMLIFLREQYKSGIISEEEYLAKMAEVVKTL